jgi:hypothetical protein
MTTEPVPTPTTVVRLYAIGDDNSTGDLVGQASLIDPEVALVHPPLSHDLANQHSGREASVERLRAEVTDPTGSVEVRDGSVHLAVPTGGVRAVVVSLDAPVSADPVDFFASPIFGEAIERFAADAAMHQPPTPSDHVPPGAPTTGPGELDAPIAFRTISPWCRWFPNLPFC